MGLERRGRVRQSYERSNWQQEDLDACDRQALQYLSLCSSVDGDVQAQSGRTRRNKGQGRVLAMFACRHQVDASPCRYTRVVLRNGYDRIDSPVWLGRGLAPCSVGSAYLLLPVSSGSASLAKP